MLLRTHSSCAVDLFGAKKKVFFSSQQLETIYWLRLLPSRFSLVDVIDSLHCYSLIAPVEANGDVPLDLASLVLREVALDQLPAQVDELIHHMTELVEQIHLVFLSSQKDSSWYMGASFIINVYVNVYVNNQPQ